MPDENLVVNVEPAIEDVQFLQEHLHEHNVAQTGYDDGEWLALFIRDAHQRIQAGLYGSTWGGCCYIRYLWVHEDWRGQGYGTKLMHAAEHEAQRRGCDAIILDTHNFQAPGFYQKLGYEVFAVLEDYPRGHRNYYLRKRLT
jgi:ribosomal protein S18 acetylase RimI-like enzyme